MLNLVKKKDTERILLFFGNHYFNKSSIVKHFVVIFSSFKDFLLKYEQLLYCLIFISSAGLMETGNVFVFFLYVYVSFRFVFLHQQIYLFSVVLNQFHNLKIQFLDF